MTIMKTRIALMLTAAGLVSAGANAGTITPVMGPAAGEKSHAEILGDIFGGVFVADGDGFTNGTVGVARVDDDDDQSYDFIEWDATALYSYAGAAQAFGTADDGELFDVVGSQGAVTGSISNVPGDGDVEFARFGGQFTTVDVTTNPSDNPAGNDHVVTYTYAMNGQAVNNTYLLFFEDSGEGSRFDDYDYNDLVVEVVGTPIPEPTSLALIGLGGLAMLRRRR